MTRKLRSLQTLVKLKQQQLDHLASGLNDLQGRKSQIENTRSELSQRRVEGSAITMPEALPYLTQFLNSVREQEDTLEKEAQAIDREIEVQRDHVINAWQETETSTKVKDVVLEKLRSEANAREQTEMDERTVIGYARKMRA